jgi:sugar O-acyltransferase (sialic acid O-acetyltransferase NeuD family)
MAAEGSRRLRVLGASGHSKVVVAIAELTGWEVVGLCDDDPVRWGTRLANHPVEGPISGNPALGRDGEACFLGIGRNEDRAHFALEFAGLAFPVLVHPAGIVHHSATLHHGTIVAARAVVQPDAVVGRHVILNTACVIEHDVVVGDFAHVAPGAVIAGGVRIGEGAFIGAGAIVIPGREIGAWSVVGAGAVVTRDVPACSLAVGVPAKCRSRRHD